MSLGGNVSRRGKHAVATSSLDVDHALFKTFLVSFFHRITIRKIDSGATQSFDLSQNEWKIFEVLQKAETNCACTVTCEDSNSRINLYLTFERRPHLSDEWKGWACQQTLASNTQTCSASVPQSGATCRVAVRGDEFSRAHNDFTVKYLCYCIVFCLL